MSQAERDGDHHAVINSPAQFRSTRLVRQLLHLEHQVFRHKHEGATIHVRCPSIVARLEEVITRQSTLLWIAKCMVMSLDY